MCKKCEEIMGLEDYVDLSDPMEYKKFQKQVKRLRKFGISRGHVERWHKSRMPVDEYWECRNWDGTGPPPSTINYPKKVKDNRSVVWNKNSVDNMKYNNECKCKKCTEKRNEDEKAQDTFDDMTSINQHTNLEGKKFDIDKLPTQDQLDEVIKKVELKRVDGVKGYVTGNALKSIPENLRGDDNELGGSKE